MYRSESHKITTEQKLKALSEQQPASLEEFRKQCEEGCARERELLKELLAKRVTSRTSPEEKLEIIRTCLASQMEYYRQDTDYPADDFVAMYQLSQLAIYCKSWEDLKHRLCMDDD